MDGASTQESLIHLKQSPSPLRQSTRNSAERVIRMFSIDSCHSLKTKEQFQQRTRDELLQCQMEEDEIDLIEHQDLFSSLEGFVGTFNASKERGECRKPANMREDSMTAKHEEKLQNKTGICGGAGYRSPCLPHAKRSLYHTSTERRPRERTCRYIPELFACRTSFGNCGPLQPSRSRSD
ncbi:hypothetical protein MPTK1_5g11370 [Marchantia polymorpha subsp. ruderalis]|uniref:Uncharacterized protein n=2 Tax=Marchantia polymorpha TaxID=3197 RepID=A0AAF6BH91_MARPO|nr:hypothetical protein MARPO_0093s0060 [Marchantia polymorpha]BBN11375.1 hypothetical protein Mp_5g11370 [Marchantia polymorpha subsp. ruderalis]|eukprot:PTQ32987.1 hypothetical protein MARPO_0093s0060 [Marchantia polymorpha]